MRGVWAACWVPGCRKTAKVIPTHPPSYLTPFHPCWALQTSAFLPLVGFPRQLCLACTRTAADTELRLHCHLLPHQLRYSWVGTPFFSRCSISKNNSSFPCAFSLHLHLHNSALFPSPRFWGDAQSQGLLRPIHYRTAPTLPSLGTSFWLQQ